MPPRHPDLVVSLPVSADAGMIRTRVQRALLGGRDPAQADVFVAETNGLVHNWEALLEQAAEWVTVTFTDDGTVDGGYVDGHWTCTAHRRRWCRTCTQGRDPGPVAQLSGGHRALRKSNVQLAGNNGVRLRDVRSAAVRSLVVLGGCGDLDLSIGQTVDVEPTRDTVVFTAAGAAIDTLGIAELRSVEVFGPGAVATDAGIVGGGFGLRGATEGIANAMLINHFTTRTTVDTFVWVDSTRGEVFLHTSTVEPWALRILWSPLLWAIGNRGG